MIKKDLLIELLKHVFLSKSFEIKIAKGILSTENEKTKSKNKKTVPMTNCYHHIEIGRARFVTQITFPLNACSRESFADSMCS